MNKRDVFDFSEYDRTYNNAIDLVAAAVGWARKDKRAVESITLKPSYYDLLRLGLEALARSKGRLLELTGEEILEMDGVKILRGNRQMETLTFQYYKAKPAIIGGPILLN